MKNADRVRFKNGLNDELSVPSNNPVRISDE